MLEALNNQIEKLQSTNKSSAYLNDSKCGRTKWGRHHMVSEVENSTKCTVSCTFAEFGKGKHEQLDMDEVLWDSRQTIEITRLHTCKQWYHCEMASKLLRGKAIPNTMTKEGSATIPEPQSGYLHKNKAMGKGKLNNTKHRINVWVYPQNYPSCISERNKW